MYFYAQSRVNQILRDFKRTKFKNHDEENDFFVRSGLGNTQPLDRPYERLSDYEDLMSTLRRAAPKKYQRAHKGTPFGFMAWYAFDAHNFETALFWLDAGISEDATNYPQQWLRMPGAKFLLLNPARQNPWLRRTYDELKKLLKHELTRFNKISGQKPLRITDTWRRFVRRLLTDPDPTLRTLISAFYVFLLESSDHALALSLRAARQGGSKSNHPFMVHLFAGGLLFESLLKHLYPHNDSGNLNETLGGIFKWTNAFSREFRIASRTLNRQGAALSRIHGDIHGRTSIETAFSTAARLRNTTGHNLIWDDIFDTPTRYLDLFHQTLNAILYVIAMKFV